MPAFRKYNSVSSRRNLPSFPPLRNAQGLFQCKVLCAMGYFLSISSSALLIESNKNYDLSHRGNIHEKLLMRQVLSPSLSLNFLCSLTPPFVKLVHTQIKFFVPPTSFLCFQSPKVPSMSPLELFWPYFHGNSLICCHTECFAYLSPFSWKTENPWRAIIQEIGKQPVSPCCSPLLNFKITFVLVLIALLFSSLFPLCYITHNKSPHSFTNACFLLWDKAK